MPLTELRIQNLRCIEDAALELAPDLSVVSGPNGAGKTSILEAIFLLGRGRSFRTRSSERLIRFGAASLSVFGRSNAEPPIAAGVEVTRAGTRARINGQPAASLLELSKALPVQAIDPEIHKLIDQGPERRRRWLDWLVFHVEPNFGFHWGRYQRALKQRNASLRGRADPSVWDAPLVEHGAVITQARRAAITLLDPYLEQAVSRFAGWNLKATFYQGWGQEIDLAGALAAAKARDVERGTTTSGPHRADVLLRSEGKIAREILSRGQQKLSAIAMVLSQLSLLQDRLRMRATLLLDDPAAELDRDNLARLFDELTGLQSQMVVTSLQPNPVLFTRPNAVFHVERGRVLKV